MPDLGSSVFSQTDANNNSGTMPSWSGAAAPSTLDDAGRALQGAVTREWNWRSYTLTAGGTADAKTLTYSVAPAAYYNGQRFAFIANTTNTGSATLNVNSLGAKTIKKVVAGVQTNLSSGDMVSGAFVEVSYNLANDCFVWTGAVDSPYFTSIELGNASDTTITRSAAGVIAVEGGVIPKENRANTFSDTQKISTGAAQALLNLEANAGASKTIQMVTTGLSRWVIASENTAESGSNAGSNFIINRYTDAGAYNGTPVLINRSTGLTTLESLAVSGNALVTGSGGLGYGTGSGGTVTQLTSKSTGVTLNTTNGLITLNGAALANNTTVSFTVTNSKFASSDAIFVNVVGGTAGAYLVWAGGGTSGSFPVYVRNISGSSLSEAFAVTFVIIKAVTS